MSLSFQPSENPHVLPAGLVAYSRAGGILIVFSQLFDSFSAPHWVFLIRVSMLADISFAIDFICDSVNTVKLLIHNYKIISLKIFSGTCYYTNIYRNPRKWLKLYEDLNPCKGCTKRYNYRRGSVMPKLTLIDGNSGACEMLISKLDNKLRPNLPKLMGTTDMQLVRRQVHISG